MDIALFSPLSLAGATCLVLGALLSLGAGIWTLRPSDADSRGARRLARAAGIAVGGTLISAAIVSIVEDEALELNPLLTTAQVAGTWRDDNATLVLEDDGQYRCEPSESCVAVGPYGRWRQSGENEIAFGSPDGTSVLRVVRFGGRLRLTRMDKGVDAWSRELTFERATP